MGISGRNPLAFVLDFDGTITMDDATMILLDRYARREWDELKRQAGTQIIDQMTLLTSFVHLFPNDREGLTQFLVRSIGLRPGFTEFVKWCRSRRYGMAIASNGFGFYIEATLVAAGISGIPVYRNDVLFTSPPSAVPGRVNPRCGACPTCKVQVVKEIAQTYSFVAYVGDGLGDRFAAVHADAIFARDLLREYCLKNKIAHMPWWSFYDIMDEMKTGLSPVNQRGLNLCPIDP